MVNTSATELGNLIGQKLKDNDDYKQDFIDTEEVLDISLTGVETVKARQGFRVIKKSVVECNVTGVNGGVDPFVLDHPVNGALDGNFYIDGVYCSVLEVENNLKDTISDFIVDENNNPVITVVGNNIVGY